ncbi:hypothetical protein [Nocardia gamkensis]|uniref:HEPN domain-containing protein n=1 Tax=Nocardia gamkensis TaxID=352869 RepID=A0A7X6L7A1_9NOCA|nr:hypothetical protein [Nocardia gamkensis]NKY29189.1 hypothetical protein [Nocardia gamkensis]NQE66094.1 hypothetical protein [Nocardia gamkensis]
MTTPAHDDRLRRVMKADSKTLGYFKEGASLEKALALSITDIIHKTTADRLRLGERFIDVANTMRRARIRDWRSTIGRYYYGMYHGMRAVSFFAHSGDDFEAHNQLFKSIPKDFPSKELRANELKDARLRRNEADYDPYPIDDKYFQGVVRSLDPVANDFVSACRSYLASKGCGFL